MRSERPEAGYSLQSEMTRFAGKLGLGCEREESVETTGRVGWPLTGMRGGGSGGNQGALHAGPGGYEMPLDLLVEGKPHQHGGAQGGTQAGHTRLGVTGV